MLLNKPHYIFAFFSLVIGIFLVFIVTPIGGIDENQHIRRVADIAAFKLLDPSNDTEDPLAIWAENALVLQNERVAMSPRWEFFGMFDLLKNLPKTLPADRQVMMDKNPFAVGNPVIYVPFALAVNIGNIFSLEPWQQFYLLRTTGLVVSVLLISIAIARMPEHKIALAALALLPAMMNSRSGVNIDGMVIGFTFLFISQVFILIRKQDKMNHKDIFLLVLFAFLMAQGKSTYVPLLFLCFLIPAQHFSSITSRIVVILMVVVPAVVVGMGWSALAKAEVLSGIRYFNDNGEVWPDGQFAWITANIFDFVLVLLKTIFTTPLIINSVTEAIGHIGWGHNFIVLSPFAYLLIIFLTAGVMAVEPVNKSLQESLIKSCFILIIIAGTIGLSLTMLYVQWSAYQAPIISGFQGRYLYPLIPLLLVFVKPIEGKQNEALAIKLLWVFGVVSSVSLLWSNVSFYYL